VSLDLNPPVESEEDDPYPMGDVTPDLSEDGRNYRSLGEEEDDWESYVEGRTKTYEQSESKDSWDSLDLNELDMLQLARDGIIDYSEL
jgi:hypothetical protein